MAKLVMLQGLPASGKSTRAKEIVDGGNFMRVNRDLIREMLHFGKWSGKNEKATVTVEIDMVRSALIRERSSVVVDDCNLNPKNVAMWRSIAEELGAKFQIEKVNTRMEVCLERDRGREKAVGAHVIMGMALQYSLYPTPFKPIVLCDLDGTLCDLTHRLQYAKGETKDWAKFFQGIPNDILRTETRDRLAAYIADGHQVMFVSARPEHYRAFTMDWLKRNGFFPAQREGEHKQRFGAIQLPYHALIMRKDHDKRDDTEVKQQVYDTYFKDKYPIEVVIDDRPKVIRMWRSNGLEVIDVGPGVEF